MPATAYTPTTTQPITNYIPVLESAAAGEARFDHNPNTFESLGLLIEESRTNLLLRSEEFDDAGWSKINSTITANTIVAPSGELTGDKHVPNSGATLGAGAAATRVSQSPSVTSGTAFILSIYAKAGEYDRLQLAAITSPTLNATFSLVLGTVISGTGATINPVGNGWYRCTLPFTATSTGPVQLRWSGASSTVSTGDGFSGIFVWGASLEQGAFPTSYVKTTTAQVTRAADAASMTGANFSSWYNQAEGTLYAEAIEKPDTSTRVFAGISDGTTEAYAVATFSNTGRIRAQNVSSAGIGTTATGQPFKISYSFESGSQSGSLNGSAIVTTATTVTVVPTIIRIGSNQTATSFWNSHIRKISYYPKRIANDQLQGLTT